VRSKEGEGRERNMIIDNNQYLMKIGGRPNDGTAWSALWAATTNYSSSMDMATTSNRVIAEGGYMVFRVGGVFAQAHDGGSHWQIICSAAATMGTNTVLWDSGDLDHTIAAAWVADTYIWAIPLPEKFPLRYLAVAWIPDTTAFTSGTMDIFIAKNRPYNQVGTA
jgi:hypothetical protein